jgi:hypothetical protein
VKGTPQELKSVINIAIKIIIFGKLVTLASKIFIAVGTDTGTLHKRGILYSEANVFNWSESRK